MTVKDLEILYDYCYWANGKILSVVEQLTPEQFTQEVGGSYGSIRNTMVHHLSAEWGWLDRCGGPERGPRLNAANYPTLASVKETWTKVEVYVREFLPTLNDEDLARSVEFLPGDPEKRMLPIGQLLQHSACHGIHHRGQVALLLRLLGYTPGNIDMLFYYAEKRSIATA